MCQSSRTRAGGMQQDHGREPCVSRGSRRDRIARAGGFPPGPHPLRPHPRPPSFFPLLALLPVAGRIRDLPAAPTCRATTICDPGYRSAGTRWSRCRFRESCPAFFTRISRKDPDRAPLSVPDLDPSCSSRRKPLLTPGDPPVATPSDWSGRRVPIAGDPGEGRPIGGLTIALPPEW